MAYGYLSKLENEAYKKDLLYRSIKNQDIKSIEALLAGETIATLKREYLDDTVHKGNVSLPEAIAHLNALYFFAALKTGNVKIIELLLIKNSAIYTKEWLEEHDVLHHAVWQMWDQIPNRLEIVKIILETGVNINAQTYLCCCLEQVTPLHAAATYDGGDIEMVRLLLNHGADTTIKNAEGKTALEKAQTCGFLMFHYPCNHTNAEIIQILKDYFKAM